MLTRQKLESLAGFADVTYQVAGFLKLIGGLRYTKDDRDYRASNGVTQRVTTGAGGVITAVDVPGNFILADTASDDRLTYRAVVQVEAGTNMLYGSVSTGFKSGGFSPTTPTNPAINPETIKAYEIGAKGSFAGGRLTYNLAGFRYDYRNLQISTVSDGRPITVNAAAARIKGIEWAVNARPIRNLSFGINGQYLDARYTEYKNVQSYVAIPGSLFSRLGPLIDASGNRLRIAPKWTAGANADVTIPLSPNLDLTGNLTYQYNSGYYFYADERVKQKDFDLLNTRIALRFRDDMPEIGIFARNLLGERYYTAARTSQTNGDFGSYGEPRRYGIYVSASF